MHLNIDVGLRDLDTHGNINRETRIYARTCYSFMHSGTKTIQRLRGKQKPVPSS